jgi:hypothetical protein
MDRCREGFAEDRTARADSARPKIKRAEIATYVSRRVTLCFPLYG